MKHFLEISQLSTTQINSLILRALELKKSKQFPSYAKNTVANLFYENSTRTRISFELAAKRLSMTVVNVDLQHSSEAKGELIEDTIKTLAAMDINLFVIRHSQDGIQNELAKNLNLPLHIINAGDGQHAHPSQAMLDLLTVYERKPELNKLKIAVIGNIRHSRVANSLQCLCSALNVGELSLIAPKIWQPQKVHYGTVTDSIEEGLTNADVIICLRVQVERLGQHEHLDLQNYRREFGLNLETIKYAKPDVMVMHPGPINRGIEIENNLADGKNSFITQQVENGVYMRMAILESLVKQD